MSKQPSNPGYAVLREDIDREKTDVLQLGALSIVSGLFGLVLSLGNTFRSGIGLLLLSAFSGAAVMMTLKHIRQRKVFEVGPAGIIFHEFLNGKSSVRHVSWSDIGYFQVTAANSGKSAIHWAPPNSPRPEIFDVLVYDLEFPDRCVIGKWPIPRKELAELLNSAHLRWRKEPA